jgi:hypothetical protein
MNYNVNDLSNSKIDPRCKIQYKLEDALKIDNLHLLYLTRNLGKMWKKNSCSREYITQETKNCM